MLQFLLVLGLAACVVELEDVEVVGLEDGVDTTWDSVDAMCVDGVNVDGLGVGSLNKSDGGGGGGGSMTQLVVGI
jgi:hypothetical protein